MQITERSKINFAKHIDKQGNKCWVWTAFKSKGYGKFGVSKNGKRYSYYAHRFSYTLAKGEIPEGLDIDHLCRNTSCVNPDHLEAVTTLENVRRGNTNTNKTHCPKGHPYSKENTYRYLKKTGNSEFYYRICRNCLLARETVRRKNKRSKKLKDKADLVRLGEANDKGGEHTGNVGDADKGAGKGGKAEPRT